MARRRKHGPKHRVSGYVSGDKITDWRAQIIGRITKKTCSRIRPGQRGAWISNERCSYTVNIDGRTYVGRGYGEGMAIHLRQSTTLNGRR